MSAYVNITDLKRAAAAGVAGIVALLVLRTGTVAKSAAAVPKEALVRRPVAAMGVTTPTTGPSMSRWWSHRRITSNDVNITNLKAAAVSGGATAAASAGSGSTL